jgi:hypothetical protein
MSEIDNKVKYASEIIWDVLYKHSKCFNYNYDDGCDCNYLDIFKYPMEFLNNFLIKNNRTLPEDIYYYNELMKDCMLKEPVENLKEFLIKNKENFVEYENLPKIEKDRLNIMSAVLTAFRGEE